MTSEKVCVFRPWRAFQGAHIPLVILTANDLSPAAKLLWALLAKYAGENGSAYPKQRKLAEDMGVNIKTLRKRLEELTSKGYIVQSREKGDRRAHKPFNYQFIWRDEFEPGLLRPVAALRRVEGEVHRDGTPLEVHTGGTPEENHKGGTPIESPMGGPPFEYHTGGTPEQTELPEIEVLENHTGGPADVHTGGSRINRNQEIQLRELEQNPLTPLEGEPSAEDDWPGFPFEEIREAYNSVAKVEGWVAMRKRERPPKGKREQKVIRELRAQWKRHKSSVCEVLGVSGTEWFERYFQACRGYVTWDWKPHLEYWARLDTEEAILDRLNSVSQFPQASGKLGAAYQSLMNAADRVTELQESQNG